MILPLTARLHGGLCPRCRREENRAAQGTVPVAAGDPEPLPPTMHISADDSAFDRCQLRLIREIVRAIKDDLTDSGISHERLADITGDVAFSIAALIDGSRIMPAGSEPVIPVLTFAGDAGRTRLIARPGGSFMHEYVHGTVDEIFDDDTA